VGDTFAVSGFVTRARNLTPDSLTGIGRFSERQIFNALRFGLKPSETPDVTIKSMKPGAGNYPLHPKYLAPPMPWPAFRHMTDHVPSRIEELTLEQRVGREFDAAATA
jgi:hypothetical protein